MPHLQHCFARYRPSPLVWIAGVSALFSATSLSCSAQLNSTAGTVTLNATLPEVLSVSATPGNVNFTLVPGSTAVASAPILVTTSWLVRATRANIALFAWFATPAAALTDGASTPNNIPSAEVYGTVPTGSPTAYTAFTQSGALGATGGGLQLFTQALYSATRSITRTDNLNLEINLTAQPQLPAGTYSGILNLQAQAL